MHILGSRDRAFNIYSSHGRPLTTCATGSRTCPSGKDLLSPVTLSVVPGDLQTLCLPSPLVSGKVSVGKGGELSFVHLLSLFSSYWFQRSNPMTHYYHGEVGTL